MKSFYKKILFFLIPILIVWAIVEVFYQTTPNNYTYKTEQIAKKRESIETLLLGDSHILFGLNPDFLTSETFNIANISQSLYFDELILNKYIDDIPNLKTVVINISYFSLSSKENSKEDRWRKYFYHNQMDLEVPLIHPLDLRKYSLATTRKFQKTFLLIDGYLTEGTIVNCYANGYGKQDDTNIVKDKKKISSIIAKKHEDNLLDFNQNTKRVSRMIELCQSKDIKVILLQTPIHDIYYSLLNQKKTIKINTTLDSLTKVYKNTIHLDWTQHKSFNTNDLRDADHLTNEGAKKCSLILNEVIEKLFF